MLGLLNTVLSRGGSLLTYVKDGLVMANRFLTPPKLTFPVDASAEFNGTSDYILAPRPLDGTLSDYTISFWMNASTGTALSFGSIGDFTNYALAYKSGSAMRWEVRGSLSSPTTFTLSSSINPWTSEWIYCTIQVESNNGAFYFNGSKDTTAFAGPLNFSGDFMIGRYGGSIYLDGNLANVAIWNRALTSDEINSVMWKTYEQVSTTEKSGLQAWYKLSADEVISGDSTATLTKYAEVNKLTFEAPACVQTALNGLPDITDSRLYSANYDIRVSADGGTVESLSCVETELNAIL